MAAPSLKCATKPPSQFCLFARQRNSQNLRQSRGDFVISKLVVSGLLRLKLRFEVRVRAKSIPILAARDRARCEARGRECIRSDTRPPEQRSRWPDGAPPLRAGALWRAGFVAHSLQTAAGMLVVRASPARQIASSKIGSYSCTDPKPHSGTPRPYGVRNESGSSSPQVERAVETSTTRIVRRKRAI